MEKRHGCFVRSASVNGGFAGHVRFNFESWAAHEKHRTHFVMQFKSQSDRSFQVGKTMKLECTK